MKTIIEWLGEIESSAVRKKALRRLDPNASNKVAEDIPDAIIKAFIWEDTPEGHYYWDFIHDDLMRE